MVSFAFWQRWLVAVGCLVVLFGVALAFLNQTALFNLTFNDRVDPVFWPERTPSPAVKAFQQWIYGVLGAIVAGWGIAMTFIAAGPFARKEAWSWNCLTLSVAAWFVIDSAITISFGVRANLALNTILLGAWGLPLLATRRTFP